MYDNLASFYDLLIADAECEKRAAFLKSLFEKFDRMPTLLLDLACGSGNFSKIFAREGVSVIGVDISADMLSLAREKTAGEDILYLNQDMKELDLYGTVDGAICTLDSLNHLESYEDFCLALKKVALFLEKDRLFIFDVNTPYKHEKILGNNCFIKESDGVFCAWQNEYSKKDRSVSQRLDFFFESGGKYGRKTDYIREIAFTEEEIKSAASSAKLQILAVFDGDSQGEKTDTSQRLIFVARKIK